VGLWKGNTYQLNAIVIIELPSLFWQPVCTVVSDGNYGQACDGIKVDPYK
jgi:hypothetical protein